MQYILDLGDQKVKLYYNSKVYSPHYSAVDTIIVASELIKRLLPGISPRVLDVACGAGTVGLGLAKKVPIRLSMSDISPESVRVAKLNAKRLGVEADVFEADLLAGSTFYDIITANLPTYNPDQLASLPLHGPTSAYDGGKSGLDLYKRLFDTAKERCLILVCECQEQHQERFLRLAKDRGYTLILRTDYGFGFISNELAAEMTSSQT